MSASLRGQSEGLRGVGNDAACKGDAHASAVSADGNRMIGTGEFHACRALFMDNSR